VEVGVIQKSGSWYSMDGEKLGQGRDRAVDALAASEVMCHRVEALLSSGKPLSCDAEETGGEGDSEE